jgi:type IV pilus assembly protein PilC
MPTATLKTFDYESLDTSGKRVKGKIDASTTSAAASALSTQGMVPLFIGEQGKGLQRNVTLPGMANRTTLKDLAIFARQFATMTASGMSLMRSLAILEEQTEKPGLKKAIRAVYNDVNAGRSLSESMATQDKTFPPLMVAMIHAGETGGFLDSALERVAVNAEKDAALRAKIKSALTYPTIVLCFAILMITGVLLFIVPIFQKMFTQLGGTLPLPTRIMVFLSHQLVWVGPIVIIGAVAGTALLRRKLAADPSWRLGFDKLKLRLPVFGKLLTKIAISRFSRNLGTLLAVGVPVMQALDIVGATTGNAVIGEAMHDVKKSVRDGLSMSAPLVKHPIFPPMVTQMMEVGEETGQISAMLDKVADFYDHDVEVATEALTAAIEPIMVVLMGAIIGTMVVCLYLPMFTIYQHIQGAN